MIDALVIFACAVSVWTNVLVLRAKGHLHPIRRLRGQPKNPRPPSLTTLP
jgi:hypothetical protein